MFHGGVFSPAITDSAPVFSSRHLLISESSNEQLCAACSPSKVKCRLTYSSFGIGFCFYFNFLIFSHFTFINLVIFILYLIFRYYSI